MNENITKAAIPALAGLLIGWAGTAASMSPRITAIEAAVLRIEARLEQQRAHVPQPEPKR